MQRETACDAATEAGISGALASLHGETARAAALFSFLFLRSVVVLASISLFGGRILSHFRLNMNAALPPPLPLVFLCFRPPQETH